MSTTPGKTADLKARSALPLLPTSRRSWDFHVRILRRRAGRPATVSLCDRESPGARGGAARRGYADLARLRSGGHGARDLRVRVNRKARRLDTSEAYAPSSCEALAGNHHARAHRAARR